MRLYFPVIEDAPMLVCNHCRLSVWHRTRFLLHLVMPASADGASCHSANDATTLPTAGITRLLLLCISRGPFSQKEVTYVTVFKCQK